MLISDAKKYIGQVVHVSFLDRKGVELCEVAEIFDVNFVPLYGPCLITDHGDIRLDRVVAVELAAQQRAA